jgi:UDP-3-O-[3-hydroxymyristoyl] glucosamine N-acyltransferase
MADERFFTKRKQKLSLADIAQLTDARYQATHPEKIAIEDVAPLNRAGDACVSFLDNIRYRNQLQITQARACFVTPDMVGDVPDNVHALITETPYKAFALTSQAFYEQDAPKAYRAPGAQIHDEATVGENCFIGEFAVIGSGVQIGDNCRIMTGVSIDDNVIIGNNCCIHPHVSLTCALIGDRVTIFPGTRIGQDGFGFAIAHEGFIKMPQLGRVIVEDDVVIGANTTIDRGSGPDTIVGTGTWIDNLVQIGHNVEIGRMCILAGQAGVSGSAKIGDRVMIGGKAGIAGHITIGNDARIAGNSGVMRDVEPGMEVMGYPALDKTIFMRQVTYLKRLVTNLTGKAKDQTGEDE